MSEKEEKKAKTRSYRRTEKEHPRPNPLKKAVLIAASILIGLPLLFFGLDGLIHWGKIHRGVTVNGISVAHLVPEKAAEKISEELRASLKKPLMITYKHRKWEAWPKELEVKINAEKSAGRAFLIGRREDLFKRLKTRFLLWFEPMRISLVYSVDRKKLEKVVDDISGEVYQPPQDASIKIEDTTVTLQPSRIGVKVDKPQFINELMSKIISIDERRLELPVSIVPVKITEREAEQAMTDAKTMISLPVTLSYNENVWTMGEKDIASLIDFKVTEKPPKKKKGKPSGYFLQAELNKQKTEKFIDGLTERIRIEPKDAQFKVDGPSVNIVPSQNGLAIDSSIAYQDLSKAVRSQGTTRQVILMSKVLAPELTTEKANAMGIKQRVSRFTTNYNPNQTSRVHNIHLLARALDGAIVPPAGIFSFNERIGPRTAEKGYQDAPTIVQGEVTLTVGGGVCQVGTTLFNTIFFAGYPVVERRNHSFYISKYPTGRDATVSYGSIDLKFKNDTSAYVLIKTWYTAGSLTIALYSTDFGTEVTYTTSAFTNIVPYPVKYVDDPTLPRGTQIVEDEGVDGRDVTVFRTVKRGGVVALEDKFFSRYKPKKAVIRNGTADAPPPTVETTPTPSP